MDKIVSSRLPPQSWIDAIAQSEAELAAGQLLDLDQVMREFDAEDAAHSKPAAKANESRTLKQSNRR